MPVIYQNMAANDWLPQHPIQSKVSLYGCGMEVRNVCQLSLSDENKVEGAEFNIIFIAWNKTHLVVMKKCVIPYVV